ncbi:MAG TPA: tetratricopeptide repeat protein [Candidatus Saccharimonadales bacterium]
MKEYVPSTSYGSNLLNSGRTLEALACFLEVRDQWRQEHDGSSSAELEQLLGICYRMLGRLDTAEHCFAVAFALTEKPEHRARIKRDWAMVAVAKNDCRRAAALLDESLELLGESDDRLEYAATQGFHGRVHAKLGHGLTAQSYYELADSILLADAQNSPARAATYQLNNLVWWLKIATGVQRLRLARRAWRLATQAGNRKRKLQIASLIVCRPLSVRLFNR